MSNLDILYNVLIIGAAIGLIALIKIISCFLDSRGIPKWTIYYLFTYTLLLLLVSLL